MKRILFIAQQAFPIQSSEAICNSKVAHALAEAGYKVDVFTYTRQSIYECDKQIDNELKNSNNLSVYEINAKNSKYFLSRSHSIFKNLKNAFALFFMGCKIGYFYNGMADGYDIYKSVKSHLKSFNKFPYDVVITRAYDTEVVGIYLKKKYGVKWIANWNDPFPRYRFPEPYGRGPYTKLPFGYKRVYKKVKQMVDLHTFPCERLKNYMIRSFETIDSDKTRVIPHMAYSKLLPKKNDKHTNNKCIKFVSCGSVGAPRDPSLFIKALKDVVAEMFLSPNDIKLYFVGRYDESLAEIVKECKLDNIVTFVGSMKYADCLDFITTCDISLIIEAQCEEGIYLPTKFVDAIQCQVPVFCVSPEVGTLHDMVNEYHNGYFCNIESIDSIKYALRQAIIDYRSGAFPQITKNNMDYFFEDNIIAKFKSILSE